MIVTIILLVICVIILVSSLYLYGKHKTVSSAPRRDPPRWGHNDGKFCYSNSQREKVTSLFFDNFAQTPSSAIYLSEFSSSSS